MNGLIDAANVTQILTLTQGNPTQAKRQPPITPVDEVEAMNTYFPYYSVTIYDSKDAWLSAILSGQLGIVTPGGYVFSVD